MAEMAGAARRGRGGGGERAPASPAAYERAADAERLQASLEIDRLPAREVVRLIQAEDARVAAAVGAAEQALAAAVDAVAGRLAGGGRLFYVGAGTSARIAALDAAELPPTYGTAPELVQVIVAGGERALLHAVEGAEDDEEAGRCEVLERVRASDAVVGLAASGTTPFTLGALREARRLGALTVAVAGRAGSPLAAAADLAVEVATGAEVIMGSTRMKAGTAQKLVLNTLSTAVMVRLGRVYSNLMVEMPATNAKLRRRAARMVELAAGVAPEAAAAALAAAGGDTRVAVLVAAEGISAAQAAARLAEHGGSLRRALDAGRQPEGA
jgi:N-acetylmuramic acid 6-phosphate etherase